MGDSGDWWRDNEAVAALKILLTFFGKLEFLSVSFHLFVERINKLMYIGAYWVYGGKEVTIFAL